MAQRPRVRSARPGALLCRPKEDPVPNIGPIELILMVLSPVLLIVIGVVPAGEASALPGARGLA